MAYATGNATACIAPRRPWAAIERNKVRNDRKELRRSLQEQLENSPLAATNDSFKAKKTGKTHA